ncbi:MAG TPA: hypothetical protein VF176_06660 [Solirubrobacterales bacterium]
MKATASLKWVGLALLGIFVAAAVAVAASRLASREIGLASEPISAGRELAPKTSQPAPRDRGKQSPGDGKTTTTVAPPALQPPATTPTSPTGPDYSGGGDSDGDSDDD